MFYIEFISASKKFTDWIREKIYQKLNVSGHVTKSKTKNPCYQIKYAKKEGLVIIKKMYYSSTVVCLSRKRKKIEKTLEIEMEQQKRYT